ncbi:MAG: alpha/beta hydrolase fold domain-containing protein [Streptosporangiales bacterium]|nr:alpha/beta hydrolase fold domain-containing protein [Streptosporangiales bacterium]
MSDGVSELADDGRLNPSVVGLVRALRRHAPQPDWPITEHHRRFEDAAAGRQLAPGVDLRSVATPGGQAEWAVPSGAEHGDAVLYLHGGGFIMGSLATSRPFATHLAAAVGRPVLTLGYSLAPQVRFPTQLDEVLRCHAWLLDEGFAPERLVLVGDSAGAWLVLAALLRLRASGATLPGRAVLLSPLLDLALASPSIDEFAGYDPQTPRWLLETMCDAFLGDVSATSPAVAPLHADLRGLPPTLVQAAELEGLRGDAERFHAAAVAAGTDCELETWPGLIHVWHAFAPRLPEAVDALQRIGAWLDARQP